jgi:hypothetical protein
LRSSDRNSISNPVAAGVEEVCDMVVSRGRQKPRWLVLGHRIGASGVTW